MQQTAHKGHDLQVNTLADYRNHDQNSSANKVKDIYMERKDGEYFMTLMSCGCRVKGLPTKKKYRFRVLAENLAGPGKPSAETDPVLIKDPIGMKLLIRKLIKQCVLHF